MSDEIFLVPVRERIASLLDKLGQTPGWLAEKAGVERSTVKRILDGQRNPTAETLVALAPVLVVPARAAPVRAGGPITVLGLSLR